MDALDRYLRHFEHCGSCKAATVEDPVCVPCPTGLRLWGAVEADERRRYAATPDDDLPPEPRWYPLGGLDEYHED